ncbi:site-specific integrase [Nonomuraea fuscirosea]|uniref:site-specific integrase n=1 Tax=Nonomuraea fuscirosea TaxID=1291556 RepID=UPI003440F5E5
MTKHDELLTVRQVLDELGGVSRRTFYRWREIGKAPDGIRLPKRRTAHLPQRPQRLARIPPERRMTTSYDVKFWEIRRNKSSKSPSYEVRWKVGGRERSKTYKTKALGESFLTDLRQAARRGEAFDLETGLPESMTKAKDARTVLDFVKAYVEARWLYAAAKSRDSMSDALATALPALTKEKAGRPEAALLRKALRHYVLLPEGKRPAMPADIARAVRWLEAASLSIEDLNETKAVRPALDALALRLDGKQAGANTIRRKRAVLHHVFEYAVELEGLPSNPLHRIKWKGPKTTETVDPRVVVNPRQARELLVALTYVGKRQCDGKGRGRRLMGMFACMYFAALRPGEAVSLREQDCYLPADGWGRLTLDGSRPEVNRRWTDTGDAHELQGLKHRGEDDVRRIPIPPELVKILRQHIEEFGVALTDGCSAVSAAAWSPRRPTPRSGRKPAPSLSHRFRSPHRSCGGRTICDTRPSRSGSTAAYRLQR